MARMDKDELRRIALDDCLEELKEEYDTLVQSGSLDEECEKRKEDLRFRMDKVKTEIRKLESYKQIDEAVDAIINGEDDADDDEELLSIIRGY